MHSSTVITVSASIIATFLATAISFYKREAEKNLINYELHIGAEDHMNSSLIFSILTRQMFLRHVQIANGFMNKR
jgi:hypothetical protein